MNIEHWGYAHKDAAGGGEFLATETADDAGLTEQRLDCGITAGNGSCVATGGPTSALATSRLDGCNAASFLDKVAGMEEQLVGVADVLDIEQFYVRIGLGVEVLVHVLQHILDAYLLSVAYTPDTVELQALDDGTLQNENGCSTRAADKVNALGVERRNGFGEYRMVVACEQSYTVGPYECCPILFAGVQDALFQQGTCLCLLAKSGRDDDERLGTLFARQQIYGIRAQFGRHHQDGQLGGGKLASIVKHPDALHLVFLGIYHTQGALIATLQDVTYHGSTGFVYIVRASYNDNALRVK